MTQVAELMTSKSTGYARSAPDDAAPDWLESLRQSARDHFDTVGFPSRKTEEWRFTNVDPLTKINFAPAPHIHDGESLASVESARFHDAAAVELVFINGHYTPQLSKLGKLPKGVRIHTLAEAISLNLSAVEQHLGQYAKIEANPFVALNTGFVQDGAVLLFPRNTTVPGVIHLLFVTVTDGDPIVTHPRVLVVAEDNVEATFVESYVGDGSATYFTNAVTEIVAGHDCRLDHCKFQQEALGSYHIATLAAHLGRGSLLVSHSAMLGAKLTRNDVNVILSGEGSDATLNGLVLLDGNRHCDNHTLLDHAAAHCPSHELYKHVLDDHSTGVFKGKILVRPDSQKTDSKQTSKTLLLSDDAVMNSMPALEIYADDVKCTHGSTTGPMDEEQLFYLRSRGVAADTAKHLMTYAFAADITRRIRVEPVRAKIENFMAARHGLPLDLRISDLGSHDEAVVNA